MQAQVGGIEEARSGAKLMQGELADQIKEVKVGSKRSLQSIADRGLPNPFKPVDAEQHGSHVVIGILAQVLRDERDTQRRIFQQYRDAEKLVDNELREINEERKRVKEAQDEVGGEDPQWETPIESTRRSWRHGLL